MLQNGRLSKSISDASWSEFNRQLEYKSKWYDKILLKIDKWEASSKSCHICGHKNVKMDLSVREWECPSCHTKHDRDFNASMNILCLGKLPEEIKKSGAGSAKEDVELLPLGKAEKRQVQNRTLSYTN